MESEKTLLTQTHKVEGGRIFEIIMNRPEVHNAVNGELAANLLDAWRKFHDDDSLTVAILRGSGDKSFCAGADLTALDQLVNIYATEQMIQQNVMHGTGPMGGSRIVQKKPVITVSQGYTYAGGLELFCHGHIRIAEKQAMFSVACRRWGVPLVDGGTVYLPRMIGWGHALPMIITGQRIRATRAYQMGLVWEVTEKGRGYSRAMKYAKQICEQPRDTLMADLNSAIEGSHLDLDSALRREAENLYPVGTSKSMKEGVEKFQAGTRFWFS